MTAFDKVEYYYSQFDEWARLDTPEGQLEFEIVTNLILNHLKPESVVFDLGGGPGRYTFKLASHGYKMHLGDLSSTLISSAKKRESELGGIENIKSINVVNALNLKNYENDTFDAVLLFGPLYHLTEPEEIDKCLSETSRILKTGGLLFATFIPWLAGLSGIIERAFYAPSNVNSKNLQETFTSGIFNNASTGGFQEGHYLKTADFVHAIEKQGFSKIILRSIRSLGYKQEKNILSLKEKNMELYSTMINLLNEASTDPSIVETQGHAIYIGKK